MQKAIQPMDDSLLKLGEYNMKTRETFTVDEAKTDDQYFVMYGDTEYEGFDPTKIYGVWGASELASIMSYYRQSGILKIPHHGYHPMGMQYWSYEQPKWVHFMQGINGMFKTARFEQEESLRCCDQPNVQTFDNEVVQNSKVCIGCGRIHYK